MDSSLFMGLVCTGRPGVLVVRDVSVDAPFVQGEATNRVAFKYKRRWELNLARLTLEEIGAKFNLTRERVRQIKEKAISRLRHTSSSKLFKAYYK